MTGAYIYLSAMAFLFEEVWPPLHPLLFPPAPTLFLPFLLLLSLLERRPTYADFIMLRGSLPPHQVASSLVPCLPWLSLWSWLSDLILLWDWLVRFVTGSGIG